MKKPIVALVGRPNVGKSTLFNRITHTRNALVDDTPGVTRDRIFGNAVWDDVEFIVVDTGGFIESDTTAFAPKVRAQVLLAIEDADAVVMVLDGKGGISPYDGDLMQILRQAGRSVFYTVNKIDGEAQETHLYEFHGLGLEKLYPISAEHGYGVSDFLDALVATLPFTSVREPDDMIRLAVVGRPNVGKSSLINRILGENRLLVSETPGTTRDAVDTEYAPARQTYLLIDTAGIRRRGKISEKLEKFSIVKALQSLDRCDVALIVLDASEGITEQDVTIAGLAFERGCCCVLLLNKWDLVGGSRGSPKGLIKRLREEAKFLSFAPALAISAQTGLRVRKVFKVVDEVYRQFSARIGTGQLNRIISEATQRTEPALHKGKRLKFYYATQVSEKPPTFVLFVNYPAAVHFSYERYLINQIRSSAGLDQTPIRIIFRQRTGFIDFTGRKRSTKSGRRT
ncbi:MAG: ribosome biogenesis GTPase Der [Desulfobacterales bacterium]|nr:ribosome biogenesis GTPase Der [Desulfobacterales bacterium]